MSQNNLTICHSPVKQRLKEYKIATEHASQHRNLQKKYTNTGCIRSIVRIKDHRYSCKNRGGRVQRIKLSRSYSLIKIN